MITKLAKRLSENKLRKVATVTGVAIITYYAVAYFKHDVLPWQMFQGQSKKEILNDTPKSHTTLQATSSQIIPIMKQLESFQKPSQEELRTKLTPEQYNVTQKEGTEAPFQNELHDNKHTGIYVDIVSGEPLFSSKDKYDSGTGWPSFVQPITKDSVTLHEDKKLFTSRTEVKSKIADSHLGHVFDDGPPERGGKRYCMNSASMRFIPIEDMEKEGYGDYISLVK